MKRTILCILFGVTGILARGQIKQGQAAPEIKLPNANGEIVSLSSLKGRVVLVDFWASWCVPCRKNNPNLVKIYGKFKTEGFEIFGVSLDQYKSDWLKAVQKDKLTWLQVYDAKGWYAQSTIDYGVDSIPASFLLDKEGKVQAINLTEKDLEKKIESLLR